MKCKKEHRFVVVVKTIANRRGAELDLLTAFAMRKPDNSEFTLLKKAPKKARKS